jgi:hypothetical protein
LYDFIKSHFLNCFIPTNDNQSLKVVAVKISLPKYVCLNAL